MNNAVFGKTMENVKHRVHIHATTSDNNAIKWFSKMAIKHSRYNKGFYLMKPIKQK